MALILAAAGFLGTALASLLLRKWFDLVLWPRVSDLWASWSQQRLKKKISSLCYKLHHPIRAAEVIIEGMIGLLLITTCSMAFLPILLFPGTIVNIFQESKEPVGTGVSGWTNTSLAYLPFIIGLWYFQQLTSQYLRWKYPDQYKEKLEARIEKLKTKVK